MEKDDEKWSREELSVFKDGIAALSAAVYKQWVKDGKPDADRKGIEPWIGILRQKGADYDR